MVRKDYENKKVERLKYQLIHTYKRYIRYFNKIYIFCIHCNLFILILENKKQIKKHLTIKK